MIPPITYALDAANQATLIYRRTKNLRAVQLLLGHSVDDALEISEQIEIGGLLTAAAPAIERWTLPEAVVHLGAV